MDEYEQLEHERNLLADALKRILVYYGVIHSEAEPTGPELLMATDSLLRGPETQQKDTHL